MKTTIITLAALALLSIGNVFGKDQLYKSVEANNEAHSTTTTICKGVNEKYLSPMKRYIVTSDLNGNPVEKAIYVWNDDSGSWEAFQKYNYDYAMDGQLLSLAFTEWDKTADSWGESVQYAMLINNKPEDINFLSIELIDSNLNPKQNFN